MVVTLKEYFGESWEVLVDYCLFLCIDLKEQKTLAGSKDWGVSSH
jgi:hypothetical protein